MFLCIDLLHGYENIIRGWLLASLKSDTGKGSGNQDRPNWIKPTLTQHESLVTQFCVDHGESSSHCRIKDQLNQPESLLPRYVVVLAIPRKARRSPCWMMLNACQCWALEIEDQWVKNKRLRQRIINDVGYDELDQLSATYRRINQNPGLDGCWRV